jgi:hypothetical protein
VEFTVPGCFWDNRRVTASDGIRIVRLLTMKALQKIWLF